MTLTPDARDEVEKEEGEVKDRDGAHEVQVFEFASAEDRNAFLRRAHGAVRFAVCHHCT